MFSRLLGRNSSKAPDKPKDIQNNQQQLQRSNASGNVLQLTKSPEEQRSDALEQERGNHTPLIAQQLYQILVTSAETTTKDFLDTDKKALGLRDELQKAANAKIEDMIDTTDGYTDEEKADAKKHAIHAAAKAEHITELLHNYARETVMDGTPITYRDSIQAKSDEGWKTVSPKMSMDVKMQVAEAQKQALKRGEAEAKQTLETITDELKKKLALAITQNAKLLNSKVEDTEGLKNASNQELELRQTLDASLVEDSVIDTVYQNKLESPIQSAALMKLGVGRGAWRRSKELNTYRQGMKDAGRDFAAADIATEIGANATTNQNDVSKKYFEMMAKAEAYVLAKGSLDTVMENEAKEITNRVIPADSTKKQLKTAAQSAAYNIARTDQTKVNKIREAARNAATTKAIEILKVKQTEAVKAARMITKGDKETNAGPDQSKRDTLNTNLQNQVTTEDEIGKKAVANVVAAQNMTSALDRVGSIINMAVPNTGDSSSLEFELKIPIAQSGAYILIGLAAEAERDSEKELAASAQLTFGAGFTTFGLDANFRAGFFLEAQGKDSKSLSNLLSYGMYRQMRKVSTSAAETLWGQGGKSGLTKTDESELWAAMVEESYMTGDNYVDVGLITKLAADLNIGVAKLSGEAGYKRLTHYDRETINNKTQQGMGNTTQFANLAKKAEELGFGANKHVIEAAAEAEFKIGGNDVAFGVEGSGTWLNGQFRELELSASGSIPFTFGEDTAEWVKIASKIVTPAVGAGKNVIGIIASKAKGDKEFGSKALGNTADLGSSIMMTIPQFESAGKSLAELIQGDETVNDTMRELLTGQGGSSAIDKANKVLLSNSLDVAITFTKEWDKTGAPDEWEIDLEVSQTKGFEVDAEIVKVGVEKSSRLGKIGFVAGGLKSVSLLGIDKKL